MNKTHCKHFVQRDRHSVHKIEGIAIFSGTFTNTMEGNCGFDEGGNRVIIGMLGRGEYEHDLNKLEIFFFFFFFFYLTHMRN